MLRSVDNQKRVNVREESQSFIAGRH